MEKPDKGPLAKTCFDCGVEIPPQVVCNDCWEVRYLMDGDQAMTVLSGDYLQRYPDVKFNGDKRKQLEMKDAF